MMKGTKMPTPEEQADIIHRERLVHIDQMLTDNARIIADIRRIEADHDRKRQEIWYQPLLAVITGMTAGAAFFAAGVAFVKVLG